VRSADKLVARSFAFGHADVAVHAPVALGVPGAIVTCRLARAVQQPDLGGHEGSVQRRESDVELDGVSARVSGGCGGEVVDEDLALGDGALETAGDGFGFDDGRIGVHANKRLA
jgi:hypothetical protein